MTIPSPLSPAFAQLQPSESLILAFYALDSALQPTGVLVQCDTTQLDAVPILDRPGGRPQLFWIA